MVQAAFPWARTPYAPPRPFASFGANNHSAQCSQDYVDTGMKRTRLDCAWWQVEKQAGVYDGAWVDALINPYLKAGVTPLVILASNNPVYYSPEEMKALAVQNRPWCPYDVGLGLDAKRMALWVNYAYMVIKRHTGQHIDWEMWNEPNDLGFWHNLDKSKGCDPADYVQMVKQLSAKLQADPQTRGEHLVVGVTYGDFAFLEAIFQLGILQIPGVKAVSFHAYQPPRVVPEAVFSVWQNLRALIDKYSKGLTIAIISSEWGYDEASCDAFMTKNQVLYLDSLLKVPADLDIAAHLSTSSTDPFKPTHDMEQTRIRREIQADLMIRTFKVNFAAAQFGVAYSIWYRYPGADQTFGFYDQGQPPRAKPTYYAMTALHAELAAWGAL